RSACPSSPVQRWCFPVPARRPPSSTPFPYTTLFRSRNGEQGELVTEFAARQIISMLATRSDLVILDLGSVIGEAGATALEMADRSEEHTSELQSRFDLVCRLLLEKKKN